MAKDQKPVEKFRKDYVAPAYLVHGVDLTFELNEDVTTVTSRLQAVPNHDAAEPADLFLDGGEAIELVSVKINDAEIAEGSGYVRGPASLTLRGLAIPAGAWSLEIVTRIKPQENTALEGLYKSGEMFCTQCEAEGFRNITFFPDRPDVMAKYKTRIEADKTKYPVLLSNGNLTASGDLAGGRHFTEWEDPFSKPCYLFALVAGDLAVREDSFRTTSGRDVALRIYTDRHNAHKVAFAMASLKRAMAWDEERFGLEYDLDLFNIVAVDDFNMGAMENKSLNIFNSRLVLATPETATDGDFARIEGVVGHEYFHNWTGNRVTCRDWFQLTLKEGLTVYRDQEFSSDLNSRAVNRIQDVVRLRTAQFPEDAGPQAHPIRPESYIKMDNFYTTTVYEKGAEVIRLYEALLGRDGFRAGMDEYFRRHDGQAVTCDDFRAAMAAANGENLAGLEPWYCQAGTPEVVVSAAHDAAARTLTITATQRAPATRGQPAEGKRPALIPIRMGLLDAVDGQPLPLHLRSADGAPAALVETEPRPTEDVLRLERASQTWVFDHVPRPPVLSLLRGFSAPVRLTVEGQTRDDLLFLLRHDTDAFNRWEASQRLLKAAVLSTYAAARGGSGDASAVAAVLDDGVVDGLRAVLVDGALDGAFKAFVLGLPEMAELLPAVEGGSADPVALHGAREAVIAALATRLRPELEAAAALGAPDAAYEFNAAACAERALRNAALGYLARLAEPAVADALEARFAAASNMTDEMGALVALVRLGGERKERALAAFYEKWREEPLVLLKWLALQSADNEEGNGAKVAALLNHPAVKLTNPNTCYSLFLGFARSPVNFHAADGAGYELLADAIVRVDKINPTVAARIVGAFSSWREFDGARADKMVGALRRILGAPGISPNVYEIASKALPQADEQRA